MIISKTDNYYLIKILNTKTNIYNPQELETLTKKIIKTINQNNKLHNYIHLEFYQNSNYGIIIKLHDYTSTLKTTNDKTVKITIHPDTLFLYQIEYFDINKYNLPIDKIYYYKNKFYLQINNNIKIKDYYKLLEISKIIYDDIDTILDKGIKI